MIYAMHKPRPMTAEEREQVATDLRSELASLPTMAISEWPMKWRFTDPKYNQLSPRHLSQITTLSPSGAKRLGDIIARSRLHDGIPFVDGFFNRVESTSIGDSYDNVEEDSRIRKWLFERGIAFATPIYLSWQPELAVKTSWKILVKYWSDFYYPISDDLTVIDGTFRWAVLFFHEHELFFGSNQWRKPVAMKTP